MKEKLKYIEAILLACSIGLLFMPFIKISVLEFSVMDILKTGLGNFNTSETQSDIFQIIQKYLKPYVYVMIGFLLMILLGVLLTALLKWRTAYIAAIVSSIVNNFMAVGGYMVIRNKMEEVKSAIRLFDVSKYLNFHKPTIGLWVVLYLIILGIAVWGIALCKENESYVPTGDIMPESFQTYKNPWKETAKQIPEEDYLNQIQRLEREKQIRQAQKMEVGPKVVSQIMQEPKEEVISRDFYGAIVGETGKFRGMAYPLKDTQEVFLQYENGQIEVSERKQSSSVAGLYFVTEYQEYCVEPLERISIFLESGQPLGIDRHYYLPRGSKIVVKELNNIFTLA